MDWETLNSKLHLNLILRARKLRELDPILLFIIFLSWRDYVTFQQKANTREESMSSCKFSGVISH